MSCRLNLCKRLGNCSEIGCRPPLLSRAASPFNSTESVVLIGRYIALIGSKLTTLALFTRGVVERMRIFKASIACAAGHRAVASRVGVCPGGRPVRRRRARSERRGHSRGHRDGEERADRRGAHGDVQRRGALHRGEPARPRSTRSARSSANFAPLEFTGHAAGGGAGVRARPVADAGGRDRDGAGRRPTSAPVDLSSARIGVNVSEREVQDLPVNGRQMSQLMLQAPGSQNAGTGTWNDVRFSGRANQQNVIKFDGVEGSAIIDASPGNLGGQIAVAVQAAGEPRERAGVPRRVEQLSGGVRHRHRRPGERRHQVGLEPVPRLAVRVLPQRQARRAELLRRDPQHRRQRHPGAAQVEAQSAPVRRLVRRPAGEGSRVLLRQLRGLSPRRRRELRRSGAERGGVGARGAGDCGAASRLHRARRGAAARRVDQPGLRHLPAAGAGGGEGERLQPAPRLPRQRRSGPPTSACSTTTASRRVRKASAAASSRLEQKPTNAIFNLQRHGRQRPAERVQGRLQRAQVRPSAAWRRR